MFGHMFGTLSELPVNMLCKSLTPYETACNIVAVSIHECLVEPGVDTFVMKGLQQLSCEERTFSWDPYHLSAGLAGSVLLSKFFSVSLKTDHHDTWSGLLISSGISLLGSLAGTSLYDSFYAAEEAQMHKPLREPLTSTSTENAVEVLSPGEEMSSSWTPYYLFPGFVGLAALAPFLPIPINSRVFLQYLAPRDSFFSEEAYHESSYYYYTGSTLFISAGIHLFGSIEAINALSSFCTVEEELELMQDHAL